MNNFGGEWISKILDAAWSVYGLGAIIAVLALIVFWRLIAGRKRKPPLPQPQLTIDVASLASEGPPAGPPILEHFNVPVRLAAVVLAPAGRNRDLPSVDQLPQLIDHIVPGLEQVVASHRPLIRCWPAQLSTEGFANRFFAEVRLPGQGGKGSPWCSIAGRFKVGQMPLMAGLVMRAETSNNFGQSIAQQEHQWLNILRVKRS
jgi:hypothetical protein